MGNQESVFTEEEMSEYQVNCQVDLFKNSDFFYCFLFLSRN
jgi:hypothetical protein